MGEKIRWGILGYAGIAYHHLIPAMVEAHNAEPYAIASRSAEKLAEAKQKFGFQALYNDYAELLRDPQVQAVYIPLPNALHKEWAIRAAEAGKHILCEKPMAQSEADCREMIAAAKQHNVKLMEAFMYRFTTRIRKLKELLDAGAVGKVRHINSTQRFLLKDAGDVRVNASLGGGSLWDVGCYPINIIGFIMGEEPVSVCAQQVTFQGVDNALSAVLKYADGTICTASSGFDAQSTLLTEINGTEGSIIMRDSFIDTDTPILLIKDDKTQEIPVEACKRYVLEVESFSKAILTDTAPLLDPEETVRNVRIINRILEVAQ